MITKDIKRKIIPYNPELKTLARELRRNMTLSEVLLWKELRNKSILGYDFDRQRPIGNFIVDFYCKELSLAVEIDGATHIYRYDYDDKRQKEIEKLGVFFLRFEDIEVKKNMTNVLRVIEDWIENHQPTPDPSREGNPVENNLTVKRQLIANPLRLAQAGSPVGGNPAEDDLKTKRQPTLDLSGEGNPLS